MLHNTKEDPVQGNISTLLKRVERFSLKYELISMHEV
jgi:hypothetical protein